MTSTKNNTLLKALLKNRIISQLTKNLIKFLNKIFPISMTKINTPITIKVKTTLIIIKVTIILMKLPTKIIKSQISSPIKTALLILLSTTPNPLNIMPSQMSLIKLIKTQSLL